MILKSDFAQFKSDISRLQGMGYGVVYDGMTKCVLIKDGDTATVEYGKKYDFKEQNK
jgi:hypothetical protein